jgi:hypothetical protein
MRTHSHHGRTLFRCDLCHRTREHVLLYDDGTLLCRPCAHQSPHRLHPVLPLPRHPLPPPPPTQENRAPSAKRPV